MQQQSRHSPLSFILKSGNVLLYKHRHAFTASMSLSTSVMIWQVAQVLSKNNAHLFSYGVLWTFYCIWYIKLQVFRVYVTGQVSNRLFFFPTLDITKYQQQQQISIICYAIIYTIEQDMTYNNVRI